MPFESWYDENRWAGQRSGQPARSGQYINRPVRPEPGLACHYEGRDRHFRRIYPAVKEPLPRLR